MAGQPLIPVEEALSRITRAMTPVGAEWAPLTAAHDRVLAAPVAANRTQPPFAVSAMDGYALRAEDAGEVPARLRVIGAAPAGGAFASVVGPGQAVRIFTGGPLPTGADAIVIQEDTRAEGDQVIVTSPAIRGRHIRAEGQDFRAGDRMLAAGKRLSARDVALAAAMNVPWLPVRRRPRIALLATGDELVRPGEPVGPHQIVSSNALGLAAMITAWGGEAMDLGIAADNREELLRLTEDLRGADMLVTLGGASVGDHDLVQRVLGETGLEVDFWKIAMRPGKPLIFGHLRGAPMLGLPGNPVSALICGLLFLRPAIAALLDQSPVPSQTRSAVLGAAMKANDNRQDYVRARLDASGAATPFPVQDSAMLSSLAAAHCLIIRPAFAPAAQAGDAVQVMMLEGRL